MTFQRATLTGDFRPAFALPRDPFPAGIADTVESVVRRSEVMAVIRVGRLGRVPAIGESLDYFIEVPCDERLGARSVPQAKGRRPYRFEVEQWHLDAASLGTIPS